MGWKCHGEHRECLRSPHVLSQPHSPAAPASPSPRVIGCTLNVLCPCFACSCQGTTLRGVAPGITGNEGSQQPWRCLGNWDLQSRPWAPVPKDTRLSFPLQAASVPGLQLPALVLTCPWRKLEEETLPRCSHPSLSPGRPPGTCPAGSGITLGKDGEQHVCGHVWGGEVCS